MLYRRPLALCCIVFVLGTSVCTFGDEYQIIYFLTGVCLSGICFLLPKKFVCLAAAFACFSAGVAAYGLHSLVSSKSVPSGVTEFSGEVRKVNPPDDNRYLELKTEKIGGSTYTVRLYGLDADTVKATEVNDVIRVSVFENGWRAPTSKMKADGIDAYCVGKAVSIIKDGAHGFMPSVLRVRKLFTEKTKEIFSEEPSHAAFVNAVLFGDASGISGKESVILRRTGTSHLICVSGLHFSLMMTAVIFLLSRLKIGYGTKTFFCILFAVSYTFLVGLPVSAVRAMLMCVLTFVARISLRKRDAITLLTVALALIVSLEPYAVYDIGTQFSFLSCAALIVLSDAVSDLSLKIALEKGRLLNAAYGYILLPVLFVLFATLFNSPVMMLDFDYFSVISPVSNLISSLLMPFIMATGALAAAAGSVIPFAGNLLSGVCSFLLAIFEKTSAHLADLKNACISTHIPGIGYISLIAAAALLISLFAKKKRRGMCFLLCGTLFAVSIPVAVLAFNASNEGKTVIAVSEGNNGSVAVCDGTDVLWLDKGDNETYAGFIYLNGHSSVKYYIADCSDEPAYERFKRLSSEIKIEKAFFAYSPYVEGMISRIRDECRTDASILEYSAVFSLGDTGAEIICGRDDKEKCVFDLCVTRKDMTYASAASASVTELLAERKADVLDVSGYSSAREQTVSLLTAEEATVIESNGRSKEAYKAKTSYRVVMSGDDKITVERPDDNGEKE